MDHGGLVQHLQHKMRYRETAKLRIGEARTQEEAEDILEFAAAQIGLGVEFEMGDTWVRANTNGEAVSIPREPRKRVAGYVVEEIDPIRAELELETSRQRVNLLTQLAAVDKTFEAMRDAEMVRKADLDLLVGELARERAAKKAAKASG